GSYQITTLGGTDRAWNSFYCSNACSNGLSLSSTQLEVENTGTIDTQGPLLMNVSVAQSTIDVNGGAPTQTVLLNATDDVRVTSADLYLSPEEDYAPLHLVAAPAAVTGVFHAALAMPTWAEPGTWRVWQVDLTDAAGHDVAVPPPLAEFTVVNTGPYA